MLTLFAYRNSLDFIPLVKILSNDFSVFSPESYELLFSISNVPNHISIEDIGKASSKKTGYERCAATTGNVNDKSQEVGLER